MQNTLRMVSMKDSVFMMGNEQPALHWLLPFPSFMFAPKLGHSEMPFPWPQSFRDELVIYRRAMNEHDDMIKNDPQKYNKELHLNYSDEWYMKQAHQKPWNEKIPKAAFYSVCTCCCSFTTSFQYYCVLSTLTHPFNTNTFFHY